MSLIAGGLNEDPVPAGPPRLSTTYKKMVEMLEGCDWKNIATIQEQNGIYIYKFTKQGKPIWVAGMIVASQEQSQSQASA